MDRLRTLPKEMNGFDPLATLNKEVDDFEDFVNDFGMILSRNKSLTSL